MKLLATICLMLILTPALAHKHATCYGNTPCRAEMGLVKAMEPWLVQRLPKIPKNKKLDAKE